MTIPSKTRIIKRVDTCRLYYGGDGIWEIDLGPETKPLRAVKIVVSDAFAATETYPKNDNVTAPRAALCFRHVEIIIDSNAGEILITRPLVP